MAKSTSSHKPGDTITSGGMKYTYTSGGHWRGTDGKLFGNGKGTPGEDAGAAAGPGGASTYKDALSQIAGSNAGTLQAGITDLANGDKGITQGLQGGAEIGASLFAPGSLGRVSETPSDTQSTILQNLADKGNWNAPDTAIQPSIDRAEKTAQDAQTLSPEQQNVLELRKAALGGLNSQQMTAAQEQAQSGFNQSLTSGIRALRVGQAGTGPHGAASNIAATPLTAQYASSQAGLARQLINDQFNAQNTALNNYASDARGITDSFNSNRIAANTAAGNAQQAGINDRASRYNNYVNYATGLSADLYSRQLQNLNTIAAEKSGQAAALFGGGSFAAQQEGQKQTFELGKQNLDLQKQIYGNSKASSGGGGGGSGKASSPGDGNSDVFG